MISLEMGELYGMESERKLMEAIQSCRNMGMSDAQIQALLDRSKEGKIDTSGKTKT